MAKTEKEETKSPFMSVDAIEEGDIPKKGGRAPAFDWDSVLAEVPEGKAQEIDTKTISKGSLHTAVKAYNEKHGTDLQVVGRKLDEKERVWLRNPAPDETEETDE